MLESHKEIIKQRAVVADDWSVLRLAVLDAETGVAADAPDTVVVPQGKVIVPLAVWQAQRAVLGARADIGVWLAPDERAEALKDDLDKFAVIAIDFPKFTDGRGYSTAFNLRMRLNYQGELRAIGDVLRDQLFQMQRCGFDAFATRQDRNNPRRAQGFDRLFRGVPGLGRHQGAAVPAPRTRRAHRQRRRRLRHLRHT